MRSIRKFAYATALAATALCVLPSLAAAENARGVFTLAHEVHWQNSVLPAGDYAFSVQSVGWQQYLVLRGVNGTHTSAMLMASDVDEPKPDQASQLVLVSRDGQSFVSSMELPQYDMALHFAVPRVKPLK